MKEKSYVRILVFGRVQGVFFRRNVKSKAKKLRILGTAKNLSDGRVEIVAEGEKENIKKLVEWIKNSPPPAMVEKIDIKYGEYKGEFYDFVI